MSQVFQELARFLRWLGGLTPEEYGKHKLEISEACETYASRLEDEEDEDDEEGG